MPTDPSVSPLSDAPGAGTLGALLDALIPPFAKGAAGYDLRAAVDAEIAALAARVERAERERDEASRTIHSAAVHISNGHTQTAYLQLFEFVYPAFAASRTPTAEGDQ